MRHRTTLSAFAFTTLLSVAARANPTVIDLVPGPDSDGLNYGIVAGPTSAFFTTSNAGTLRLFRSDGTGGGTVLLDTYAPNGSSRASLTLLGATAKGLFFSDNQLNIWLHNSGPGATLLGKAPADGGRIRGELSNGITLFSFTIDSFTAYPLFRSDGTAAGTGTIVGANFNYLRPDPVALLGSFAYYVTVGRGRPHGWNDSEHVLCLAPEHVALRARHRRLRRQAVPQPRDVDGGVGPLRLERNERAVASRRRRRRGAVSMRRHQGLLQGHAGRDGLHGAEPWTSDGTTGGTVMLADVKPGPAGDACSFSQRTQGTKVFCRNPSAAYEADGTAFVDRTAAFKYMTTPL